MPATSKITKIKKVEPPADDFWAKNREKVRVADSVRQAEGLASTARVKATREDIEAKAEDEWSAAKQSQDSLRKKRETSARKDRNFSMGGGM